MATCAQSTVSSLYMYASRTVIHATCIVLDYKPAPSRFSNALYITALSFAVYVTYCILQRCLSFSRRFWFLSIFLPRCTQCRRGIAMRILSVCPSVRPSVRLSHACIVTKRKKDLSRFLYHTKDNLAYFSEKKNGMGATSST